jgi:hypothetical protein
MKYGELSLNISLDNQQIVNYNQKLFKRQSSSSRFAHEIKIYYILNTIKLTYQRIFFGTLAITNFLIKFNLQWNT